MSRFLLLAALFLLLSVVSARTPFTPSSSLVSASPAACANGCSSHGNCTSAGAVSTCLCEAGYLGADCSVASVMKPMCWLKGELCSYWQVQGGYLYQRVVASEGKGWAAVMWGSTDGMAMGQSTILTIPTPLLPTVFEGYNTKKGKPTNTTGQSIAQANVTGCVTATGHLDVSFTRPLNTGLADHFVIPAQPGTSSSMSVAHGSTFFEFHGANATYFKIDIAAAAAGSVDAQPEETTLFDRVLSIIRGQ